MRQQKVGAMLSRTRMATGRVLQPEMPSQLESPLKCPQIFPRRYISTLLASTIVPTACAAYRTRYGSNYCTDFTSEPLLSGRTTSRATGHDT